MADEVLINRLYDIVDEITRLGGEQERTSITPGVLVAVASPSDLPTGYIKIVNPRDSTYVPCLTVNGLVVSDNDLVNVLFTRGTEPIALSQSANSPSNTLKVSEIWDSAFNSVAMESDATGNITINSTGTLTIPTDIIHSGDTDTKISLTDDAISFDAGGLNLLKLTETAQDLVEIGDVSGLGDVDINANAGQLFLRGSDGRLGVGSTAPDAFVEIDNPSSENVPVLAVRGTISTGTVFDINTILQTAVTPQILRFASQIEPSGVIGTTFGVNINPLVGGASSNNLTTVTLAQSGIRFTDTWSGTVGTLYNYLAKSPLDIGSGTPAVTTQYGFYCESLTFATTDWAFYAAGTTRSYFGGNVGIGISPQGRLHGYDSISGFLHWEYDGLDGTSRTIIPNGTGDVLYNLFGMYNFRDSGGSVASGTFSVANGGSTGLAVGANTVTVAVAATGAVTVSRTAGANTIKVSFWLLWL